MEPCKPSDSPENDLRQNVGHYGFDNPQLMPVHWPVFICLEMKYGRCLFLVFLSCKEICSEIFNREHERYDQQREVSRNHIFEPSLVPSKKVWGVF